MYDYPLAIESRFDPSAQTALYLHYGIHELQAPMGSGERTNPKEFSTDIQRAYPFTTEHMTGYIAQLDLGGNDVAAICGSGDFTVNAMLYGANSVDCIDTMPATCLYAELKMAGIAELSRDEFLAFFNDPEGGFSFDKYLRIRPNLSNQAQGYFDQLITTQGKADFLSHGLFIRKIGSAAMPVIMNPYLQSESAYAAASEKIRNVQFHPTGIAEFLEDIQAEAYDAIYLSNIFHYMSQDDARALMNVSKDTLRPGGKIIGFTFLPVGADVSKFAAIYKAYAGQFGLTSRHLLTDVPHAGPEGDNRGFVNIMEKPYVAA